MLTEGKARAILVAILIIGVGMMFFLTTQTDLDYHNIRGIVGLTMSVFGGLVLLGIQWYWWQTSKKANKQKDDHK